MATAFKKHSHYDSFQKSDFLDGHNNGKCKGFTVEAKKDPKGVVMEVCKICGDVVKKYKQIKPRIRRR